MTKPVLADGQEQKGPEVELAETEAWADFDKIDTAAAGRAAASPAIDGTAVTKAFEQVTDEQTGAKPATVEKPAATVAAEGSKPATAVDTKAATNPWDFLPEEHRAKAKETWERENAALLGRVAPVQRKNAQLERELAAARNPAKPAPKPKDIALPGDAGWEKFKKDYPEIATPIEQRLGVALSSVRDYTQEAVETRVKPVETNFNQSRTETELERAARVLAVKHPDFQEISDSKEFEGWLATQRPRVAALIDSADPEDADYLLTQFKASSFYKPPDAGSEEQEQPAPGANGNGAKRQLAQPALDPRRQRQLDGARTPAGKGAPAAAAVTVIPDDPQGAWDAFEKLDAAKEAASRR